MKIKSFCKFVLIFSFIFCSVVLFSCKKEEPQVISDDDMEIVLRDFDETLENDIDVFSKNHHWYLTNKRILVLFAYDFNYYPVYDNLLSYLGNKFGLDEDGGLIYPVLYPDDFRHGGKTYVSDLFSFLNDNSMDFEGIIILGAPENTHYALAKFQDAWNGKVPYPIIALFPQDEVLGLESCCDIVIDKNQGEILKNTSELEEESSAFFEDAPSVISDLIEYIHDADLIFYRNSDLLTHVNQALKNSSVSHYVDPETGISSINHFVLN